MKYLRQYWFFCVLGIIWLPAIILSLVYQHNEHKLEYRPGEIYNFTLSNITLDLWGDNITVIYHYDNINFVKMDKYYFQE
jgi:hypothetical protein